MARETRPVTIRDVASRAGVSISTVSHALSGHRPISPATRARVLAAAAELGYGANPLARSLRTGRSNLIGLILRPRDAVRGSLGGTETFNRLSGAIATAALARGHGLVHVPDILDPAVRAVPMDGCIVAHPYGDDEVVRELLRRGMPVVTVDEDPDRPDFAWSVRLDYVGAVNRLLDRLHAAGARRVMLLTGTEDNAWNRRSRETYLGWARRHRMRPRWAELYEGEGVDGAARFIEPALIEEDRPDAVVAAASRFAAGIVKTADKLGIDIPGELRLASLTDSDYTRANVPPISAIDLNLEQLGLLAVELMLRRLEGRPPPARPIELPPVHHWRRSTQPT